MNKSSKNLSGVRTTAYYKTKRIRQIAIRGRKLIIMLLLMLMCVCPGVVKAREEVPSNLIKEKENSINEIMLGASSGITLVGSYTEGTTTIRLSWNAVEGATKYTVYQSKNGGAETVLSTVQGTSVTLNQYNAGIRDEAAPTMPKVTATPTADQAGNNIHITPSTDNGTTYRHRVETSVKSAEPYTEKSWIKAGSDTWTVPEGVTRIRVAVCGGGGGAYNGHGNGIAGKRWGFPIWFNITLYRR